MIKLALFIALQSSPDLSWTPACLTEVAAITGDRIDFASPEQVEAARVKATSLSAFVQDAIARLDARIVATNTAIFALERREAAGEVPAGSTALFANQEDPVTLATIFLVRSSRIPSCGLPRPAAATLDSIRQHRETSRTTPPPVLD